VVESCLQNLKPFRRISTFLPHRLTTLKIHLESFGWNPSEVDSIPLLQMQRLQDEITRAIAWFAILAFDNVHIEYAPSKLLTAHGLGPCFNETVFKLFKTKLSSLNIWFFDDMKNTPPPMPSLKNLDLGVWGSNSGRYAALRWWKDLRQFPLDRLRISNHQLPDNIQLPITITSLSVQECPGFTNGLNLAFFHLPNLVYLDISLRMRNVQDALSEIDALFQLDIVSTKLRSFRMCRERHDLNLFQKSLRVHVQNCRIMSRTL
jgi:hypothetical protein